MHRLAYAPALARGRGYAAGRGAVGELLEVRNRRGAEALRRPLLPCAFAVRFCLLPFALLALYFAAFSAFSAFLDNFIDGAAFFKNRRQFRALLGLCWQSGGTDSKKTSGALAPPAVYRCLRFVFLSVYSPRQRLYKKTYAHNIIIYPPVYCYTMRQNRSRAGRMWCNYIWAECIFYSYH